LQSFFLENANFADKMKRPVMHLLTLFRFNTKKNTAGIYISPMAAALVKNYTIVFYSGKANNR